jgi:competence protein ComEC
MPELIDAKTNSEHLKFSMSTTPFAFIFIAILSGIIAARIDLQVSTWSSISFVFLAIGFTSHFLAFKNNLHYFLYFLFLFAQLGYFNTQVKGIKHSSFSSAQYLKTNCEIIEIKQNGSKWNKGIAIVKKIKTKNDKQFSLHEKILFYTDSASSLDLREGDLIILNSEIQPISNKGNPGEFNAQHYWKTKEIRAITFFTASDYKIISRSQLKLKRKIKKNIINVFHKWLPKEQLGISKALFLGDKSSLEQETRNAYSAAGAMHLLAISGLHIGLFVWIIFSLLRLVPRLFNRKAALLITFVFVWNYAYLIDFPPSVLRSVLMFSILGIGHAIRGDKNQLNILFFSATLLLIYDPLYAEDIGFQLSYSAIIGIILCYRPMTKWLLTKNRIIKFLWNISALCISAQLFTLPLCLFYFHQFPNYFLVTNLGVVIMSGTVVGLGLLLIALSKITLIAMIIAQIYSFSLSVLTGYIQKIEGLPASVAKGFNLNPRELIIMFIICFAVYLFIFRLRKLLLGCFFLCLLFSSICVKRIQQIKHKHLVLFNTNKFSCAYYDSKNIFFFHDHLNPKKIEKLLIDYEKVYPGRIIVSDLETSNYKLLSTAHVIELKRKNNKLMLNVDKEWFTVEYNQLKNNIDTTKTIGLPWVENVTIRLDKAYFFNL